MRSVVGCGVVSSIFSYRPLWETMKARNISQYHLIKHGIDNKTLDSLKKGKNITMITLDRLCCIIGCSPNDVVEILSCHDENTSDQS